MQNQRKFKKLNNNISIYRNNSNQQQKSYYRNNDN